MASPRPPVLLPSVVALGLLLAGCSQASDEGDGGGAAGGSGSASAYVKDAPSDDFREVHVVFTEVSVHRSGEGDNGSAPGVDTSTGTTTRAGNTTVSGGGSGSGWIVLFSDAGGVDVDLLNTTGPRAAFLGEEDLAAGHYQQVRITVKEAWGITHDGEREDITVSSGQIRSVRGFDVESGQETRITIDIDLDRSLRQQANGQWRMTPVIGKTTAEVIDDGSSGEDTAQPGDIESVPESGSGVSGSVGASGSVSATGTATSAPAGTSAATAT